MSHGVAQAALESYIVSHQNSDLLRFMTCGSVDDGKSTLIGRLLWEANKIFDDQLATLKTDSQKYGVQQDGEIDFALLVDGLLAEREQNITIDVAYRFLTTHTRRFIIADTPGHEQYTHNMATAASMADVALILVDARKGILTQTHRHTYLVSLMGIRHIVLAINKMDLLQYSQEAFTDIQAAFEKFSKSLGFESITVIPMSAQKGVNIMKRSNQQTPWYTGPTLMDYLETVKISKRDSSRWIFPVQWVNRPHSDFRGFSGRVAEGSVQLGDEIRVSRSGQVANVSQIVSMDRESTFAMEGESVTLVLDHALDISRGDILSLAKHPLETTDQFEAVVIWVSPDDGLVGRTYELKLATQWVSASITTIKYRMNVDTLRHEPHKKLMFNDICVCTLSTHQSIAFDAFSSSKTLGSFILVDRFSHLTVAAGLIRHSLRRAQNVHTQPLSITQQNREKLNGHSGKVIWFTGLSGSGKSTIANALEIDLHSKGYRTYILDGDNLRQGINKDLGFTDTDRVENIRRITEIAKLMMEAGLIVIAACISPFRQERESARILIGSEHFIEVYVDTPLEICEARDPKNLYRKARMGKLPNLSGIGSAYEPPENPEVILDGRSSNLGEAVKKILKKI